MRSVLYYACGLFFLSLALLPQGVFASTINKPPYTLGLTQGLVGYWTFDGKDVVNGKALDASGNSRHANLFNIATSTFYTKGKLGQAFKFSSSSATYVETTSAIDLTAVSKVSVSFWAKVPKWGAPNEQGIISLTDNASTWFTMTANNADQSGYAECQPTEFGMTQYYGTPLTSVYSHCYASPSANEWHHYVLAWNSATPADTVYIDGVLQSATNSFTSGVWPSANFGNAIFVMGTLVYQGVHGVGDGEDFTGTIDDVHLYNRILTATEARQLYNQGAGTKQNASQRAVQSTGLNSGLVGHWTFDGKDMAQNVADSSGNGNTGYLSGFGATSSVLVSGKIGQALSFSSSTANCVNIPRSSSLDFFTTPGVATSTSFSAWIFPGQQGQYAQIFGAPGSQTLLGLANYKPTIYSSAHSGINSTNPLTLNTWHHIVGTLNNVDNTGSIYVDGVLDANTSDVVYFAVGLPGYFFTIGCEDYGDEQFNGKIDDVRFYNRILSATEIKQLYNQGAGTKQNASPTIMRGTGLTQGLVGYWTFDGKDVPNGVALDKSGNGNNGNLINISTSTFYAKGKIGQGFKFDGVDDYINMGNPASLSPVSAGTVSFWTKWTDVSSYYTPVSKMDVQDDINGYGFFTEYSTGLIDFIIADGSTSNTVSSVPPYNDGRWHHIVGTWDGTNVIMWVDGTLSRGITQTVASPITNVWPFNIGRDSKGDQYFPGPVDDVRVYNRALSASEVKQLYNMGK